MRRSLLLTTLALLSPTALAQESRDPSPARADVCRVEVLRGRARVFRLREDAQVVRRGEARVVAGNAHLEVAAGSEARVSWLGRASLRLWGPGALEWSTRSEGAGPDLPNVAVSNLRWTLFDVGFLDLEVRRGDHELRLPGDWRAEVGVSALHLRGLPSGPLEIRHGAGVPLVLRRVGDPTQARPPLALYAGSTLRVDRPLTPRADLGARAEAWDEDARWPWRARRDTRNDRMERVRLGRETTRYEGFPTLDPAERGPVQSVRGFDSAAAVEVRTEVLTDHGSPGLVRGNRELSIERIAEAPPQPRRTALSPLTGEVARQEPRPETLPRHPDPAPPVPDAPPAARFDARHWRGLLREELAASGPVAVQQRVDVTALPFPSGRTKVHVDALADDGVWCFSPTRDWWLEPGAVAVFERDGTLKLRFGRIDEHLPHVDRPAYDELGAR